MSQLEEKYQKRKLRGSYVTSVAAMSLVLFLLGVQGSLSINAKKLSRYMLENIGFSVILDDNTSEATANKLKKTLEESSFVKSAEYVSADQAAKTLAKDLGEDFVDFIGYNPILASVEVKIKADYANSDSIAVFEKTLLKRPEVKEIYYRKNLVENINNSLGSISAILLSISLVIFLAALALVNNTIRLSVYSKRLLINTMRLVGATNSFIRRPFIISGIIQGFFAALFANLLLLILILYIGSNFSEYVPAQNVSDYILIFISIFVIGFIFTTVSSFFAVRRFLKMSTDDIYF